jgi:arginine-tRNA-protein transferase
MEICLYDGEKLVGCGFFDLGLKSAAGISSFYDPDYKKFSPGKYLIYQKIHYCKNAGLDFFYPGYFVSGYPFFDYKLEIGGSALEYYEVVSGKWMTMEAFSAECTPIQVMTEKLRELNLQLQQAGIRSEILKYEYFDANILIDSHKVSLFDFPIFIQCRDLTHGVTAPVVYNIYDNRYHLLQCGSLWSNDNVSETPGSYSSYLLRVVNEIFASSKPEEMVAFIAAQLKKEG